MTFFMLLVLLILIICLFEILTSNTVVNIVNTGSLSPIQAALFFGVFNLLGILVAGIGVAMALVDLIPIAIFKNQTIMANYGMVLSIALTSLFWYFLTTRKGVPGSSTHTLFGAILGVLLVLYFQSGSALPVKPILTIGVSLIVSPFLGYIIAIPLSWLLNKWSKSRKINSVPVHGQQPPPSARIMMLISNAILSFSNGSNNGQKGLGIIMMALIATFPASFSVNVEIPPRNVYAAIDEIEIIISKVDTFETSRNKIWQIREINSDLKKLKINLLQEDSSSSSLTPENRFLVSRLSTNLRNVMNDGTFDFAQTDRPTMRKYMNISLNILDRYVHFVPAWVIVLISIVLTIGAAFSYRRIAKTFSHSIGKKPSTYLQNASSDLSASMTIGISSMLGVPVSTSHTLTGGMAGSITGSQGWKNVDWKQIGNIVLYWIITLPATIIISFTFYQVYLLFFK